MTRKEIQLVQILNQRETGCTSSVLAELLSCSVRTVKNYAANINREVPGLIESSRHGYVITDHALAMQALGAKDRMIPQDSEGRQTWILKALLLGRQEAGLDELCDELYISPATLNLELAKVKIRTAAFDLQFKTKNNVAFLEGLEKNKKKMIASLIFDETKDSFYSLDRIQAFFPEFSLKRIREIVVENLLKYQYFADDYSMTNVILMLAIAMDRQRQQFPYTEADRHSQEQENIPAHVEEISVQILSELEEAFGISYTEYEHYNLALLLSIRLLKEGAEEQDSKKLKERITEPVGRLMEKIQSEVRRMFYINLNDEDFYVRFSLHLQNMLIRLENEIELRNPQTVSIKNTAPFIYDVSVFIANIIQKDYGFTLSEDEIAYIALHIGVLIDDQLALRDKIKGILYCPQYYSVGMRLADKISVRFEDSLILMSIATSSESVEERTDADLIVATAPLEGKESIPVVQITTFLDTQDVLSLTQAVETLKKKKLVTVLRNKLTYLFKEELFYYDRKFKDNLEAISTLADALEQGGYVDSSFKEKLFEREKLSPSAYANIAIPHPLELCARNTAIAVSIHPFPISWDENKVNIIFMLAVTKEDHLLFQDIFQFVTEVVSEPSNLSQILSASTYEEFINILLAFAD